jgi:P27 family predicted phage terminase small subunit
VGSGGHNRKPKAAKVLQGTFRKDRNPAREPEPPKVYAVPKPPGYLGRYGKQIWKKLAADLVNTGVLTTVDLPAFELCCEAYDQYRESRDSVYAFIVDDETGKRRRRTLAEYMDGRNSQTMPEYAAMKQAFVTFKSYLVEFGLTPASRNRIDLKEKVPEVDPMEALVNGD